MQPTKTFNEGALLPLMEILEDNNHIKKLNLASSGMHDARCVLFLFSTLSHLFTLSTALPRTASMILISISFRFRSGGNGNSNARVLNTILKKNTVIEEVNLSFTGLDDDGIEEVRT